MRLVVFEGRGRNPLTIFNEKAVLGLGRGLVTTGRLNEEAVEQALTVMVRYHTVARAMGADPVEVLATAAVRDAQNGPAFVAALRARLPDLPIRVLTGQEEALLSADGVLLGFPDADGVLGDIGGGSLELVELAHGRAGRAVSLPLGAIRLSERAGGEIQRGRAMATEEFNRVPWLSEATGRDLYLVGGAWRALARMHIAQTAYPLSIVHHYVLSREEARDLSGVVMAATRRTLDRMPGAPTKRVQDLPWAAMVMRRLLRASGARRVVFSANGLREGWYARQIDAAERQRDPLLAAAQDLADRFGRDPRLPPALAQWTAGLFERETTGDAALRAAACWISDIGSHDHPDYRAEHAYFRVLRQPGVGPRPPCAGLPRPGRRAALRGRAGGRLSAGCARAAGCGGGAAGGNARGGAAAGLYAVGRHAGIAGGHRARTGGRAAGAAPGRRQRRVCRRERAAPRGGPCRGARAGSLGRDRRLRAAPARFC